MWRSKTGSTGQFTFEVYSALLWEAAYQYDLNKATKQPQRKAFISHQDDPSDGFEHGSENRILQMILLKMNLSHTQFFSPLSMLLHLKSPQNVYSL